MISLTISRISISLLFLIPLIAQPLSLGLCIILITTTFSILLALIYSSWFSYILFLVFIGGLLVIFAYVSILVPNTIFSRLIPIIWIRITFTIRFYLFIIFSIPQSHKLSPLNVPSNSFKLITASGHELASVRSSSIIIILGLMLLFALLAVVKICYYQQRPLRPYTPITK